MIPQNSHLLSPISLNASYGDRLLVRLNDVDDEILPSEAFLV